MILAPSDAWVSYAGPFRSFGQLLILNAGGGYYIILAGMDRITVGLGQFVLAGEPLAVMAGSVAAASGANSPDIATPTLYIEFRKDGTPFDPASWWVPGSFEKEKE
jgi:septal ring factor EnvC (AmiA/AmiB activator)